MKKFRCEICGEKFSRAQGRGAHIFFKHSPAAKGQQKKRREKSAFVKEVEKSTEFQLARLGEPLKNHIERLNKEIEVRNCETWELQELVKKLRSLTRPGGPDGETPPEYCEAYHKMYEKTSVMKKEGRLTREAAAKFLYESENLVQGYRFNTALEGDKKRTNQ